MRQTLRWSALSGCCGHSRTGASIERTALKSSTTRDASSSRLCFPSTQSDIRFAEYLLWNASSASRSPFSPSTPTGKSDLRFPITNFRKSWPSAYRDLFNWLIRTPSCYRIMRKSRITGIYLVLRSMYPYCTSYVLRVRVCRRTPCVHIRLCTVLNLYVYVCTWALNTEHHILLLNSDLQFRQIFVVNSI